MSSREEGKFLRGEIGVDGEAIEDERDVQEIERDKAVQQLLRGRTYLGRELLTWLLWRTDVGGPILDYDGEGLSALFVGTIVLRGLGGDATELSVKGAMAAYSEVVKAAIDRGLLVHQARLRLQHGERAYEVTIDAEHLAVRSAELPKVLAEEDDERLEERLYLAERLCELVDAIVADFVTLRASPKWASKTVPTLRTWAREGSR